LLVTAVGKQEKKDIHIISDECPFPFGSAEAKATLSGVMFEVEDGRPEHGQRHRPQLFHQN
jgi:hypothetical protein